MHTKRQPKARKHESKFSSVEEFRVGTIKTLWTDTRPFPTDVNEKLWWEFWCFSDSVTHLVHTAGRLNLRVNDNRLYFPDLEVVPIYGSSQQISQLLQNTDAIEELRRASDNPTFFTTTLRHKQEVWVEDLLSRARSKTNRNTLERLRCWDGKSRKAI